MLRDVALLAKQPVLGEKCQLFLHFAFHLQERRQSPNRFLASHCKIEALLNVLRSYPTLKPTTEQPFSFNDGDLSQTEQCVLISPMLTIGSGWTIKRCTVSKFYSSRSGSKSPPDESA